jgi:hypothetical protein
LKQGNDRAYFHLWSVETSPAWTPTDFVLFFSFASSPTPGLVFLRAVQ